MANRKKPGKPKGRPKDPKNENMVALFIEVDPRLKAALEAWADRERRSMKAQLTILFEKTLGVEGLWPPPANAD